ncbi:hypothetical protein H0E87_026899 [Populus deltoides]|uniref:WRKY domain-containing protein n=1 Tax=Populus deltoides TaxID=3696 RepID=A0A8T2WYM9_POPDE|nr:hypothetical protein H0E87_026899 [Populus deltoides]
MEIKESERVVIAKPVASRPSCSKFRSFSELLAGAINTSPSTDCSEMVVAAIRPKTLRFRPTVNRAPGALVSSQVELSGTTLSNSSNRVSSTDSKTTVIYKPQAKFVSKATVSLLASMGNFNTNSQQMLQSVEARPQCPKQNKQNISSQLTSNLHQNIPSHAVLLTSQNQEDPKSLSHASNGDRASYDGYNWRKYGQKQVKGKIVYKGEHNHSKPQPPKRNSSGTQGLGAVSDSNAQDRYTTPLWSYQLIERNEGSEGREENQIETGLQVHSIYQGKPPPSCDRAGTGSINAGAGTSDNSCGLNGECNDGSKGLEGDDDEPRNKRRKAGIQSNKGGISGEGVQEPRVVVQSSTDSEILGDGFRWRKYGQKIVRGNPYPRSYYRCTSLKCNVRKHVERASDDPKAFITTYEGKHNHEMPLKSTNIQPVNPDLQAPPSRDKL